MHAHVTLPAGCLSYLPDSLLSMEEAPTKLSFEFSTDRLHGDELLAGWLTGRFGLAE